MASSMTKNMEKKLYEMINCLADNYGFDVDEAFEFVRGETDVDHVGEIIKMIEVGASAPAEKKEKPKPKAEVETKKEEPADDKSEAPTESSGGGDVAEKIAACKKNISLWEKKLADGKSKDADKQREKITKEKAKLSKLEAKVGASAPSEKPAVVETKKPEEDKKPEPKKEEKEKRIKRFSPVMASQLKKALDDSGVEINDKLKKEFQQFIEDLTDDDFRAKGLADHMRAFAKLKSPTKAPVEALKQADVDALFEEIDEVITEQPKSNAAGGGPVVVDVTIEQLRKITTTASMGDSADTLWDADNGRFVKGPDCDSDEDVVEVVFKEKSYVVGEKTGRVYEVRETGDVFAGFSGVGKFKELVVS